MKKATLSRRLLAGAAGLAIGLGGMLVLSSPAQAAVEEENISQGPIVVTQPTCDDAQGHIEIPEHKGIYIRYRLNGDLVPPGVQSVEPGDYTVKKETRKSKLHRWKVKEKWTFEIKPADCEEEDEDEEKERKKLVKEPGVTPPTCDDLGSIQIPEAGHIELFVYSVNGEPVDRGTTVAIGFGSHTVEVHGKYTKKLWKVFQYDFEEQECPEEEPSEEPGKDDDDNGGGGELPVTGAQSALIAGGALVLLTLGGAMYFVARRRRITFTA